MPYWEGTLAVFDRIVRQDDSHPELRQFQSHPRVRPDLEHGHPGAIGAVIDTTPQSRKRLNT
jgi:hypothetical protein